MVFYFTSNVVQPSVTLFMGEEKHESKNLETHSLQLSINLTHVDEELIKWGWPEDVWFHVDKLSSAHVYLRLNKVFRFVFRQWN